ncbi:MAG: hypothetical protein ABIF89_02930 [bacterium]
MRKYYGFKKNANTWILMLRTVCFLAVFCCFVFTSYAQEAMKLEDFMRGVNKRLLELKKTQKIIEERTKVFKKLKIIDKNAELIMAGFDCNTDTRDQSNLYAYLYHNKKAPVHYCLVIDNFGTIPVAMNYKADKYLFKANNKYYTPLVSKKRYDDGQLYPRQLTFVDLGFNEVPAEDIEALAARINLGKTVIYLTRYYKK